MALPKRGLTEEQILNIAKSKGMFFASLRWRDDKLRAKCFSMKKRGLLCGAKKITHGGYYFYPKEPKNESSSEHR
jgi:hypothetical protein